MNEVPPLACGHEGGRVPSGDLDRFVDNPTALLGLTRPALEKFDRPQVEAFQLAAVKRQLERLAPRIPALEERTGSIDVTGFDDLVPMLFESSVYKSYDEGWLDAQAYDEMTRWIDRYTVMELSAIDATGCSSLNEWCALLLRFGLRICHSSGTSGVLSFVPRTAGGMIRSTDHWLWEFQHFEEDAGHLFEPGSAHEMTIFFPYVRHYYHTIRYLFDTFESRYHGRPTQAAVDTLSPDLIVAMAKLRRAQSEGTLDDCLRNPRIARYRWAAEEFQEALPDRMSRWIDNLVTNYQGEKVLLFAFEDLMYEIACRFRKMGVKAPFAQGSLFACGGGAKGGGVLPENWLAEVCETLGIDEGHFVEGYGSSESSSNVRRCPGGNYHFTPMEIPFLLEPGTRRPLPRSGTQTGQLALINLIVEDIWTGVITEDRATVRWESPCACGRHVAHILGHSIGRIADLRASESPN